MTVAAILLERFRLRFLNQDFLIPTVSLKVYWQVLDIRI